MCVYLCVCVVSVWVNTHFLHNIFYCGVCWSSYGFLFVNACGKTVVRFVDSAIGLAKDCDVNPFGNHLAQAVGDTPNECAVDFAQNQHVLTPFPGLAQIKREKGIRVAFVPSSQCVFESVYAFHIRTINWKCCSAIVRSTATDGCDGFGFLLVIYLQTHLNVTRFYQARWIRADRFAVCLWSIAHFVKWFLCLSLVIHRIIYSVFGVHSPMNTFILYLFIFEFHDVILMLG